MAGQEVGYFKPNLAGDAVLGMIDYSGGGYVALPKLNGVRGCVQEATLLSRTMKPIPNAYVRTLLSDPELEGFEGELVVGDYADENVFTNSSSGVMSIEGYPEVVWHVFDYFHPTMKFIERIKHVHDYMDQFSDNRIQPVPFHLVTSDVEVKELGDHYLNLGYEGLVLRKALARYKQGRSTAAEGGFLRYVPWDRSEAVILAIHEGEVNNNESVVNELGYKKKSTHKDNKVGSGRAGAVTVRDLVTNMEFNIPVPTVKLQEFMWAHKDEFMGKILKYKFKKPVKVGGKPRFPQWEGLRSQDDM